jgi:hypothetical protein
MSLIRPPLAANTITAKSPTVFVQNEVLDRVLDRVPDRVLEGVSEVETCCVFSL